MTLARSKMSILVYVIALLTIIAGILAAIELRGATPHAHAAKAEASGGRLVDCAESSFCAEVADPASAFPGYKYVGHDEPSNLFYSNVAGSGNNNQWRLKLPSDPTPKSNGEPKIGQSFNFQLHPAFWFGMAMCDTQSYPERVGSCAPDSDSNITSDLTQHPGTAFMEMQFYPPGWELWPPGDSCSATQWCAALNIDSLSEDPVNGTTLNKVCQSLVGIEYVNFAFITSDGVAQAPANPVQATATTYTPDPSKDLFMNTGDRITLTMHDTSTGLFIGVNDLTTHQTGSMTASSANGFGQVRYAPKPSNACDNLPYDFHPMYSTSSPQTRVIWAAHTYNIAFTSEIGHFENCNGPNPIPATPFGLDASGNPITCPAGNTEGFGNGTSATDGDDAFCFPGTEALRIHVNGCTASNTGFDSLGYQPVWPDGNRALHPQPIQFSSPRTGAGDSVNYSRTAFEADLPRIEGTCNRSTGAGCTLIPTTDKGTPAAFYP